jgi:hypothetical protein
MLTLTAAYREKAMRTLASKSFLVPFFKRELLPLRYTGGTIFKLPLIQTQKSRFGLV